MLIDRRSLILGAGGAGVAAAAAAAATADPGYLALPSMRTPGQGFQPYGAPAEAEAGVVRWIEAMEGYPLAGASWTPLHLLEGTITPNGLHFERHHAGVPTIDPARHELVIQGEVERPLAFSIAALRRYPMETHSYFIECAGNSGRNVFPEPAQLHAGALHGLLSNSEWTGVPLPILLNEAGVKPDARWLIAEGADAAAMSRSIPMEKCLDDAMVALYQNGEPLRPAQGYPLRLILPGFEGNMQIKWLHRLKATRAPAHSREETARYTQLLADGRARQFNFLMGCKSVILRPSPGLELGGAGPHQISGLAWSGAGKIENVQISTNGGRDWQAAQLDGPVLPKAATRFRLGWEWAGNGCILMSRATDEAGNVQPFRSEWMKAYAPGQLYHYNAVQAWAISDAGAIANVYA